MEKNPNFLHKTELQLLCGELQQCPAWNKEFSHYLGNIPMLFSTGNPHHPHSLGRVLWTGMACFALLFILFCFVVRSVMFVMVCFLLCRRNFPQEGAIPLEFPWNSSFPCHLCPASSKRWPGASGQDIPTFRSSWCGNKPVIPTREFCTDKYLY